MTLASPGTDSQPKSRRWIIVSVAVVVFCCLCSIGLLLAYYLYNFGDQLFGLARLMAGMM